MVIALISVKRSILQRSEKQQLPSMVHFSWGSGSGAETEPGPRIMLHLFPRLYFSFGLNRKRKKTQQGFKSPKSNVVRTGEYSPTGLDSGTRALIFKWMGFTFDSALKMVQSISKDYLTLYFTIN